MRRATEPSFTARLFHDGSNGNAVNRRTRVRDQVPMSSDRNRAVREKAK